MEAMLCLRVPLAPACRPDFLLSHPSQRNPLRRRHFAFPHGGARVAAAARLWAVCFQPPAGEDAGGGRAEGWHRRRGAAVGPVLVLACALRVTGLKHGGRAYCSPPNSSGDVPPTSDQQHGGDESPPFRAGIQRGVGGLTPPPLVNVLSGIFRGGPAAAKEPLELHQLILHRIEDEVRFLHQGFEEPSLLRLLLEHLSDQVDIHGHSSLEASDRGLKTTSSLYKEWEELAENERKYNLGLLLVQIFINQGDHEKAKEVCEDIIKVSPAMDERPRFIMDIIKAMLDVQRMSKRGTTQGGLLLFTKNMIKLIIMIAQWENCYNATMN
ncbi:uncharacterized protein LOC108511140 [Phoenix dactylifera]|uniref:Uncharacterized protein LOC108511140 n=1 Tax=Phoenix dactylifera TaxID=42345 RepID=A0A8B9ANM5_PHODC|nr:uncharacterized protein LOC108511140 [Phoenix dactylifera]